MRVLITGASGSGTTTLGEALATQWGAEYFDADDYLWLPTEPPYLKQRPLLERADLLSKQLGDHASAVVSGAIMGWGAQIEDNFDLIVFLYADTKVRLLRLEQRELQRFGKVNPDFLAWAAQYDSGPPEGRSLVKHNAWLAARTSPVLRLSGELPVAELLRRISNSCPGK
jgi:hypothetical protein